MELKEYIRIIVKGWWWIIPMILVTITLTLLFSYSQTPIYGSTSTYVTGLDTSLGTIDTAIYGIDTLTGRQRIFVTYCEVLTSHAVTDRALGLLNLSPQSVSIEEYDIRCNVLPESNVLMLIVEGPAPQLVERLNEAIGLAGIERVNGLYDYFPIENLDTVSLGEDPISPNHSTNAILGGTLGIIASVTLAMLLDHFRRPGQQIEALSIRHAHLNVYKDNYFQTRLKQEIHRANVRNRPLCIAFLKVIIFEDFELLHESAQTQMLRSAALQIQDYLRHGDIVAYRENRIFEIMLPEISGHEAEKVLEELHQEIRHRTHNVGQHAASFNVVSVLIESSVDLDAHDIQETGLKELAKAEKSGKHTVSLISTSPDPFVGRNGYNSSTIDDYYETRPSESAGNVPDTKPIDLSSIPKHPQQFDKEDRPMSQNDSDIPDEMQSIREETPFSFDESDFGFEDLDEV